MIGPPARPGRYVVSAGLAARARRPGSGQPRACKQAVPEWPTACPRSQPLSTLKISSWTRNGLAAPTSGAPRIRKQSGDVTLPSLRIPTRTGLTAADPIAEALTSNARAPGVDSFESAAQRHRQPGPHPSVPIPTRAGPHPPGPRRPLPVPARSRSAAPLPPLFR